MPAYLDQLSRAYGEQTWSLYRRLDQSLQPASPDQMHELAAAHVHAGDHVLDAGCRDAAHLIRLVQTHKLTGVGVDPVPLHVQQARMAVADAKLGERITILQAGMEDLPYPDSHFDVVWCRDVLEVVELLRPALRESARLLKPNGLLLVYTQVATPLLARPDYDLLARHLGVVVANLSETTLEAAFRDADFAIERKHIVGTEWREYLEESTQAVSRDLLRLARLRRDRDAAVQAHGQDIVDHVEANLHWGVFQLLGKLQPVMYVLHRN